MAKFKKKSKKVDAGALLESAAQQPEVTGPDIETKKVSKDIVFKLTEAEFAKFGKEQAHLQREYFQLEADFVDVKSKWKARLSLKDEELRLVRNIILAGEEIRNVECEAHYNYSDGSVKYYFEKELVEERAMSAEERQTSIDEPIDASYEEEADDEFAGDSRDEAEEETPV